MMVRIGSPGLKAWELMPVKGCRALALCEGKGLKPCGIPAIDSSRPEGLGYQIGRADP